MISDRRHTAWLMLDDLIGQARLRWDIYQRNVDDIEQAKLAATNDFHGRKNAMGVDYMRELAALNEALISLDQQQREERVSFWKDVSKLRLSLPESAQQYLSAHRKMALLEDPPGDEPC